MGEKRVLQLQCCCTRLITLANDFVCLSVHFYLLEENRETPSHFGQGCHCWES